MADAIAKLPADQQEKARRALGAKSTGGDIRFDVWIDGQQLPRKTVVKTGQTAAGAMTVTLNYHDFNQPVQISAPPAGQVRDFGSLMKGLGTGATPGA
jgi:hypothetical protein